VLNDESPGLRALPYLLRRVAVVGGAALRLRGALRVELAARAAWQPRDGVAAVRGARRRQPRLAGRAEVVHCGGAAPRRAAPAGWSSLELPPSRAPSLVCQQTNE
jgi:hypothetical protein